MASDDERERERKPKGVRIRSTSLDDFNWARRHLKQVKHFGGKVGFMTKGMAYMGIDWYQVAEKKRKLSYLFLVQNMYYWCYAGYIVAVVALGAVLIYGLEPEGGMSFPQAIYTSAACVSQSGLAVVDWSKRSNSTYTISFCLILLGSAPLLHCVPVILREKSFRMQARLTAKMQRQYSCDDEANEASKDASMRRVLRRTRSDPCVSPTSMSDASAGDSTRNLPPVGSIGYPGFGVHTGQTPRINVSQPTAAIATLGLEPGLNSPNPELSAGTPLAPLPTSFASQAPDRPDRRHTLTSLAALAAVAAVRSPEPEVAAPLAREARQVRTSSSASKPWSATKEVNNKGEIANQGKAKLNTCSNALALGHRLEYKALRMVLKIMLGYWFASHAVGIAIFFCYFHFFDGEIQERFHAEGLHPFPHAVYLTVSAFQNNGLVMTPSSVMDFAKSPLLLNTVGALVVLGNTGLPIMIRLIATVLERRAQAGSQRKAVLDFLLEHPRRCFTHMFPAVHTLWLLLVIIGLNVATTVVQLWQDHDSPAMMGMDAYEQFWNALFQSISCRTAGLNSVNIAYLSQGTTFLFAVMMYLATTPTVVTMRLSAVTNSGQPELDITGRAEGVDEELIKADNSLKSQARRYLTQDITYLTVCVFFICCLEKDQFTRSAKDISPDSDGIYGDFTFFKVLFELASAYGTCGLSLGWENQTASFSGVWCTTSQMLLVVVMILGRLRGLPDSIDPSVRVDMSHTADLEARDEEHRFVHA